MVVTDAGPGFAGHLKGRISHWHRADPATEVDSHLMARSLGVVGILGCALVFIYILLPTPSHTDRLALAVVAAIGLGVGLVLASGLADRQPPIVFEGAVVLATTLTSLGVYFVHLPNSPLILFYLWCTPYAYWFFTRARALIQTALVVIGFGSARLLASAIHPALAGPISHAWGQIVLLAGTVIVSGELVYRMRLRISESQSRFARIFESAPTPMARLGSDLRYIDANHAFCAALGRPRSQVVGAHAHDFAPDDQRKRVRHVTQGLFDGHSKSVQFERDYLRADGGRLSFLTNISILGDPELGVREAFIQALDVTERERARHALVRSNEERRRLLAELVRAQEDERRRIAADVHDESIQVLAGVAIRLGLLNGLLDRPEQLRLISGLDESVRRGIKSLRRLLFELRLPALDELGLAAAIRSYLEETVGVEGTSYRLDDRVEVEPPPELRTVLYRIAQEALSNVRKHSHAAHVDVLIEGSVDGFTVSVRDDGVGFDVSEQAEEVPGHLGLVGMRERVQAAGGWIEIRSEPGHGTAVEFGVPAEGEATRSLAVAHQNRA